MAITLYHVLSNAKIHNLLQEEVQIAMPDASVDPSLSDLARLPYLVSTLLPTKSCVPTKQN
jgi:hypothetical protein